MASVAVTGSLSGLVEEGAVCDAVLALLLAPRRPVHRALTLDCAAVTGFTGPALVLLAEAIGRARAAGLELRVRHLSDAVRSTFVAVLADVFAPPGLGPLVKAACDLALDPAPTRRGPTPFSSN